MSPPGVTNGQLATAFFLSPSQAWAIAYAQVDTVKLTVPLTVFASGDGGQHWKPEATVTSQLVFGAGPVYLTFADSTRGWLVVDTGSHGGFMSFKGFKTNDGGGTWMAASYPQSAPVRFVNQIDGFSGGGVAARPLYATHDGGQTWAPLNLPPAGGTQATAVFQLPDFSTNLEGVVAGQAWQSPDERPAEVFYTTTDGGRSWSFAAAVANPDPRASAITGMVIDRKDWLVALPPQRASGPLPSGILQLKVSHDAGRTWQWLPTVISGWIREFSFGGSTGWAIITEAGCHGFKTDCYNNTGLFETIDFGAHWTQLTLG